ncbi:MAG: LemA family protein [Mycoplasma sp.]
MNLYSGHEQTNPKGHDTVVNNNIGPVVCTSKQRNSFLVWQILGWVLGLIGGIILLIWSVKKKNYFNKQQIEINNSASNIDVQLQKRSETLIKLLDSVKGHTKFEKETLTKITQMRSGMSNMDANEKSKIISDVSRSININVENYPELKASQSIQKLMTESAYIEKEIAANRRLYNSNVTRFNQDIFVFPSCIIAEKSKLSAVPLFAANEEAKKDVKLDF